MKRFLFAFHLNDHHDTMVGVKNRIKIDHQVTRKWGQKPSHLGNFIMGHMNEIDETYIHSRGVN